MTWPDGLHQELQQALNGNPVSPALQKLLLHQKVFTESPTEDLFFPLTQITKGRWTNSHLGHSILKQRSEQVVTVLDPLSWSDIQSLPNTGAFLYLGDAGGGFWASQTSSKDGLLPCPRCLILRYLAGRQATPDLYRALREGATVGWETVPTDFHIQDSGLLTFGPEGHRFIDRVLPLPDCPACLERSQSQPLTFGPFSPVTKLTTEGHQHSARLCQTLWLCDTETVGHGGSYDTSPERGVARAVNEALERYAAHFVPSSVESEGVRFESSAGPRHFRLQAALLREPGSVSTGLACRDNLEEARDDGLREVCERDALARFWLDLQDGRCQVALLEQLSQDGLELEFWQIDSYDQPVVLSVGRTSSGGAVTGSACGPDSRGKSLAECLQNAAYLQSRSKASFCDPPESFDHHLQLYWSGQKTFPDLNPWQVESVSPRPLPAPVFSCELTTEDLKLLGRRVVRVQVPGLIYLPMSHYDWPTLLGSSRRPPMQPHPFG